MSELHQPVSDSLFAVSQSLDREPSTARYSACDGYSLAASGASPTPSCTSTSSIRSVGAPILFSSSSPALETSDFSPGFETSPDEPYLRNISANFYDFRSCFGLVYGTYGRPEMDCHTNV
ncbi:hypothetical protein V1515DRAFT_608570 [Lipomyces mesembrius]